MHRALFEYLEQLDFSIAYAAMHIPILCRGSAKTFSIAYAAMHWFPFELDQERHFSIAYAAMHCAG